MWGLFILAGGGEGPGERTGSFPPGTQVFSLFTIGRQSQGKQPLITEMIKGGRSSCQEKLSYMTIITQLPNSNTLAKPYFFLRFIFTVRLYVCLCVYVQLCTGAQREQNRA